jgi:hypothetical protein
MTVAVLSLNLYSVTHVAVSRFLLKALPQETAMIMRT